MTLPDVGVQVLDREGDRVDLLHELAAGRAQSGAAPEPVRKIRQSLDRGDSGKAARIVSSIDEDVLGLLRVVALVVAPEDLLGRRVDDDGLDRRAPDVHANGEPLSLFVRHPLLVRAAGDDHYELPGAR